MRPEIISSIREFAQLLSNSVIFVNCFGVYFSVSISVVCDRQGRGVRNSKSILGFLSPLEDHFLILSINILGFSSRSIGFSNLGFLSSSASGYNVIVRQNLSLSEKIFSVVNVSCSGMQPNSKLPLGISSDTLYFPKLDSVSFASWLMHSHGGSYSFLTSSLCVLMMTRLLLMIASISLYGWPFLTISDVFLSDGHCSRSSFSGFKGFLLLHFSQTVSWGGQVIVWVCKGIEYILNAPTA